MRPMGQQQATDLLIIGSGPSGLALSLAYDGRSQILESSGSVGGLCLLVEKALPEGTMWRVRACSAPDSTPWAEVEIKTCRPEKGDWEVGCRFVQTPTWAVLLHFG